MDKQFITKALENYTQRIVLLTLEYERKMINVEDYDRRSDKIKEKFLEEMSAPELRLVKENKTLVYDYNDKFWVEVVEEKNYRSAWLQHKRNHGGYDYPKMFLCGAAIEDPERITDELDIFLDRVKETILEKDSSGCDYIDAYNALYVGEEE